MAITVEDGTGLAGADSFISVADADTFHTDRGNTTWTGTDAVKEVALRRASFFLTHAFSWKGEPLTQRTQALAWPRVGVIDGDGFSVDSDAVPQEIKDATCLAALQELVTQGSLNPITKPSDAVDVVKIGPLMFDFANSSSSPLNKRTQITEMLDVIADLRTPGSINAFSGDIIRS